MELTSVEIRVLGCLVEKQRTTPDAYPLSVNALRAACNQATNRDPVVEFDEGAIREALERLHRYRLTRLASGAGSRAAKYRHLLDEALGVGAAEQSVLAVLMLRGPQTPGELRQRTERMHRFPGPDALRSALETLVERGLAERLERRPGQKEERYAQRLGGRTTGEPSATADPGDAREASTEPASDRLPGAPEEAVPPVEGRLAVLEDEVAALREEVARLRELVGELRVELGLEDRAAGQQ